MDILVKILYMITMGAVKVWRMFMYVVCFIGFRPIKAHINKLLKEAGIGVNGEEPHCLVVHNDWFYHRVYAGTLGLGEAYIDGWWDCQRLDEFFSKAFLAGLYDKFMYPWDRFIHYLQYGLFNLQTVKRARQVADAHYDLGNEFFKSFLGKSMNYSCGYWKDAENLDEAQQRKMELIGRKLKLKPGMRVLDLGCGWGGLCQFLAETYDVNVVGVTISKEGAREAQERCKDLSVEIRVQDYRDVNECFDRIVSVESFEHVGPKNHRTFFKLVHRCLSNDGLFLLHSMVIDNGATPQCEAFLEKYIFPNLILPSHKEIPKAIDNLFCVEDLHNIGQHYDKTFMAWHDNFVKNWHTIIDNFDKPQEFYRMFTYCLCSCAGLYRSRRGQLWQIVMTKSAPEGYDSVR